MADVTNDPFRIKMHIVADTRKLGEGAKVVAHQNVDTKPRVDITTDVGTGFEKQGGTSSAQTGQRGAGNTGAPVPVGKGGGVLGHLLGGADRVLLPDPEAIDNAALKALLAAHVGKPIVVTTWDREEASTLKDAQKKHSVGDVRGELLGVDADGIRLKKDGRVETVRTEFWAVARIKLNDDSGTVLAQNPSYPSLFMD